MKKKQFTSAYVSISAILLSCLGGISVGFSTWVISQGDTTNASGNINADSIDTNINGVTVTVNEVFEVGHYHFKNTADNTYLNQNSGTLSYNIKIDVSEINTDILTNNKLNITGSLSFEVSNLPIFDSKYVNAISYTNSSGFTSSYTTNNDAIEFTIQETIDKSGPDLERTLSFTFNNKMIAKYYNQMNNKKFYLRLEAM